jgi:hypothetical protein
MRERHGKTSVRVAEEIQSIQIIRTHRCTNNSLSYEFIVPNSLAVKTKAYETASLISHFLESPSFQNLFLSAFLFLFPISICPTARLHTAIHNSFFGLVLLSLCSSEMPDKEYV